MDKDAKIYVAGGDTFIGAAILRQLKRQGYKNIVGAPGEEPVLTDASHVDSFFAETAPEYVFMAAGKIAGIGANQKYPAQLMLDNLLVTCNMIDSAHRSGVKKLLYLGSSCGYPKYCSQPMRVESLMTGQLEPTSEFYATAKIAGIKLYQAYNREYGAKFVGGVPANPFGPGDDFDAEHGHVIGALIRKVHDAKLSAAEHVEVWGTGTPRREFIFIDDLADACIFVMSEYDDPEPINLGSGSALSVAELAQLVKEIVGYRGAFRFDTTKPDGMPLKVLDSSRLVELGWRPKNSLREGLASTYQWFCRKEQPRDTISVR